MSLLTELKRRNVIRMAGLYLVGTWLLVQVASTVLPAFDVPPWALRALIIVVVLAFVPALVFAWVFELTPEGIRRDAEVPAGQSIAPQTARRMDRMIITVLGLALLYFAVDKFVLAPRRQAAEVASVHVATPAIPVRSAPSPEDKSIAVLPFENLSEDKANGFFADGIQDQILTGLAKIGDLKVISRTSTQRYASRPENLSRIARELGVAHILEGSVQRSGNKVRINVQLIEASTDSHLWADTYDRSLDDVFAVESEVAQKIADSLAANLSRGERAALAEKPTDVPAAYEAYLRARAFSLVQTREQLDNNLAGYREAVRLDPKFALAWAQLARESFHGAWVGLDPNGELQAEGKRAMARANALAPGSAQAELARGVYMYYIERDFSGALTVMNALKARLPNDADVWMWAGFLSRRLGLWQESTADFMRATELSPNDDHVTYHLGVTLFTATDCALGLPELDLALAMAPDNTHALAMKLQCAWMHGNLPQADAWLAAAPAHTPPLQGLRGIQKLMERDYAAATQLLQAASATGKDTLIDAFLNGYLPARVEFKQQLALARQRAGATAEAQAIDRQLLAESTAALATMPDNRYVETGWHLVQGLALAGLGQRDAAAAQARLALTLVPEESDRLEGPAFTVYVAKIYALNGDAANALPLLRHLLQTKGSFLKAENLRLDPVWDGLRKDPGFIGLIAAPKT